MSISKYSKHQKSRHPRIVLTTKDGEHVAFKNNKDYEDSELRKATKREKDRKKDVENFNKRH